jgi:hypothetical protein
MGCDPPHTKDSTLWFNCLQEECLGRDGLLCFYDRPKSPQVDFSCEVLARYVAGPVHGEDL